MTVILEASPVGTDELADWLELFILKSAARGIGTQALSRETADQLGIEDHRFAHALNALQKRAFLLPNYPFEVNEISVKPKDWLALSPYTLLLLLSRPSNLMKWQSPSPTPSEVECFENLVCIALENYFGPNTQTIPFGWPSKCGRPENFDHAIIWLAEKIGIRPGRMYRSPRRKDGGVDVVLWRKFPDNRSGFPLALVQCTLQQNYVSKSRDIDLRLWSGWLELDREPTTILAIPNAVPGDEQWQEATANSVVFERIRLAQNLSQQLPLVFHDSVSQFIVNLRS